MSYYIRLDDLDARLNPQLASPHLEPRQKAATAQQKFELIDRQLGLTAIRRKGAEERYPEDQIYLDLLPIFTSAVCRVFQALKALGIGFKGYDADVYMTPFTSEIDVDLSHPTFSQSRIDG